MRLRYFTTILILIVLVNAGQATIFLGINSKNFKPSENFDDDLFIGGNLVRFESDIDGDLIGASRELVFSGDCSGNIIWGCQWITIGGTVNNSVRTFAQTININAEIGRNLIAVGQKVIIGPDSRIGRDATIFAEEVEFDGYLGNKLKIGSASVILSGQIDGDISIQTEKFTIMPNTIINGNFIYETPEDIKIPNSVEVSGEIKWVQSTIDDEQSHYRAFMPIVLSIIMFIVISLLYYLWVFIWLLVFNNTGLIIVTFLSLIICGLITLSLSKKTASRAITVLQKRFLTSFGLGLLLILLFPLASLIAFISLIGWPLGFILLFAFGTFSFAGAIYSTQFIGCAIGKILNLGKKPLSMITYIIGIIVVALLSLIPIFGWLVVLVILASGLGSVVLSLDKFRDKKLFPKKQPDNTD